MGELVATLALAQDSAFGQPLESQHRSCLLAMWLCDEARFSPEVRDTVYWVALLRYIGCTGHAHEVASLFGDEIAIRAQTLVHDAADPTEVMRDVVAFATAGRSAEDSAQIVRMIEQGAHAWAVHNFASGCEVGDRLAQRLDVGANVREALRFTFERWNGNGFPTGAKGSAIPLAMRIVHLSHDMEAIGRRLSPAEAVEAARRRRDRTYDPDLADIFVAHGARWFERLAKVEPWDAVLELEPHPRRTLTDGALDEALTVAADFIDLKSPFAAGHSRRCAQLCEAAGQELGLGAEQLALLRRAALVHDIGVSGVSNAIWDKPGALTRAEFDRVELHPMLTEQMLRRSPALALLNPVACAHHEKCDGSGYHRRHRTPAGDLAARLMSAVDIYVGLTTERADRPAWTAAAAATELRRLADARALDPVATEAVLAASGHAEPEALKRRRQSFPRGLSRREIEVLQLAAKGLTTQGIAERLFISPKTADHHIQHVYTKIGVSTRAAATLWAIQNAVVQ